MAAEDSIKTQQPTESPTEDIQIHKQMNSAGGGRRATTATTQQSTEADDIVIFCCVAFVC